MRFDELDLSPEVLQALSEMGFEEPTPIQAQAIPICLTGSDLIGQAQTGTGKTAAFGIPLLENIDTQNKNLQALVLSPTRELAIQIAGEFAKLGRYKKGLKMTSVFGGASMTKQIESLQRGTQVIVGTPGRIIDLIERGYIDLSNVETVVLDEADEMLNMGFRDEIEGILKLTPDERQTLMFSATMSKEIKDLALRFLNNPQTVSIVRKELTNSTIEQWYYDIPSDSKVEGFARLVEYYGLNQMLVFCNMKKSVDEVVEKLQLRGFKAEGLHGDMQQWQRNSVMSRFRKNLVNILVATDVAARGIDVSGVDAVFNYDIPLDVEYYVHRIGRTGRAGRLGKSFSFISGAKEMFKLRDIEKYIKTTIGKGTIPSTDEITEMRRNRFAENVKEMVTQNGIASFEPLIESLAEQGYEPTKVAAALVKLHLEQVPLEDADFTPTFREKGKRDDRSGKFSDRDSRGGDRGNDRGGRKIGNSVQPGMTRLFINLGKADRLHPKDIVETITSNTSLPGRKIGDINIFERFSFINIPQRDTDMVINVLKRNGVKGKSVNVEVARDK
jgi:ATP-dependent RNA helicase DeaD